MAEGEFPKRLQLPRILERRRAPAAFQLEATHGESGGEIEASDSPTKEADTRGHRGGETNTEATLSLREAKRQPPLPLDEIATVIQSLTYGEMIELSEAMWKNRPNGSAVTLENLPELLHRWSTSHSASARNNAPALFTR
jgi:hypothetical protein